MKIMLICVGKTKERFIREGVDKYLKFLGRFTDVELKEIREEKILDLRHAPAVRKKEAERIFKAFPSDAYLLALDERGQEFTSHEFAQMLNSLIEAGVQQMVFVAGGAMGLDATVTEKAKKTVALSRWTLTHDMARLVALEQLYRAFTILTGKTYHY